MSKDKSTSDLPDMGNEYDMRPIESPILTGWKVDAVAGLTRSVLGGTFIQYLNKRNDVECVRRLANKLMHLPPKYYPMSNKTKHDDAESTNNQSIIGRLMPGGVEDRTASDFAPLWKDKENVKAHTPPVDGTECEGFAFASIADYRQAYEQGEVTPVHVLKAYLEIVEESEALTPPLRAILSLNGEQKGEMVKDAQESAERYAIGAPKSPLDGILVALKDSEDVRGYETGKGTSFLGEVNGKAKSDGRIAVLLREAGAIIVGKTNMHEIGIGTTGFNLHWGTPRNPYDPERYTGGSSSGSAAAVAAGLVPFAVAVDGGGSVRIPAAFCGAVGLKATFKRIATYGDSPTVVHVGPITTNVLDNALAYSVLAGPRAGDTLSQQQPPPHANSLTKQSKDLKGVRIGIFPPQFEDADEAIVQDCRSALKKMEALGAEIVQVSIPCLREMSLAHAITITSEMALTMDRYYDRVEELSPETQISLELGRSFSSSDLLAAHRVRAYAMRVMEELFEKIDVYATPATGIVAPKIRPEVESRGESNLRQTQSIMRHMTLGNLVGIPGMTFPVGYTSDGLPTSMMIQSAHWEEDVLFRVASALELPRKRPKVYYSVLDRAKKLSV